MLLEATSVSHASETEIKQFYNCFKHERAAFCAQIEGSASALECAYYGALMLNRLMFLYFLQTQGFLAADTDYLAHHLQKRWEASFYRAFLLPLFHEGLSTPPQAACFAQHVARFGHIPCLGGSLFSQRAVERENLRLAIPDAAFRQLFAFFDTYHWSLNEPSEPRSKIITPAILGAIFELHVNQQQMGAYYTKEDVTLYIARNTIIPYLLDALLRICPTYQQTLWQTLQRNPERYIPGVISSENYLPGETAREYSSRRTYYSELCARILAGELASSDDLITYNLNSSQFLQDAIGELTDPALVSACYQQLSQLAILDPTCGSGAFLFAAIAILLPLYDACLERMAVLGQRSDPGAILAGLRQSPGRRYYILKAIITHNLYGVDIMAEASEICKLRLFLTLIAQIESTQDIEPLPNLDQHIHVGNVLAAHVVCARQESTTSEQPDDAFHWQRAFAPVLAAGGFHIIIGNPPYVEYSAKTFPYTLNNFATLSCANLYPCVIERSRQVLAPDGRHGMILPLAAFATRNMIPFIESFRQWFPGSWLSFYHFRPAMLFSGDKVASIPTAIYLARAAGDEQRFSTRLHKWSHEHRQQLFAQLTYCAVRVDRDPDNRHYYPKFGSALENDLLTRVLQHTPIAGYLAQEANQNRMFYRSAGGLYWKVFVNFPWPYSATSNKQCSFQEDYQRDVFVALLNSSLFWWYYTVTFDTFNLKNYMLFGFRFTYPSDDALIQALTQQCQQLMADFQRHAKCLKRGDTDSYTIYARKSKPIIDEIDRLLAQHYGFSAEELDFILHYDSKYRVGLEHFAE